jgi:hypothetical protein
MSRGTAVPTVNEKLTLVRGCTFSRVIDSATRVRCWSLMLTEAFTFVDDCAEFVAVDGWLAGCCAAVFALPLAGACWAWLLAGGCCGWPVAGVAVFVCACVGWDVPVGDVGVVV